jgi:hypothetical protein
MLRFLAVGLLAGAGMWGCALAPPVALPPSAPEPASQASPPAGAAASVLSSPAAGLTRYRCDQGLEFTVRFINDTALLDSAARGHEVLLRDAGGLTPQQTVYSNSRLRAEFGLGTAGREAILRYLAPALVAHCSSP